MKIYATMAVIFLSAIPLSAADPYLTEAKTAYDVIKTNLLKSAEKMPEDGYGFQPTKEERTFAALIGHIADAQTGICSIAAGAPKPRTAGKLTAKTELVAALKASNEECDKAFAGTNAENATTMVKMGPNERSRLSTLIYNTTHDNESYGTLAVYLRLKGVVPPSSEK
jgi:uncharacterized damage-inducible protein DinB